MKSILLHLAFCLALGLALLASGCGRGSAPKAVARSDIPAQLDRLFAKAPDQAREVAAQARRALGAGDLSGAWVALQALSESQDLTKEQQKFLAGAIVALGAEIDKARQQGDERADEAQRMHRMSK